MNRTCVRGLLLAVWAAGAAAAAAADAVPEPSAAAAATAPAAPEGATGWPNVRPLVERSYERTPERRARGEYLAEGLLQCIVCHSARDWSQPGGPPRRGREGAGVVWFERGERRLVAPNLTPDPETGAGRWTDDMLARAIREGVAHDGRPLHPQMWYGSFRALSDEDVAAVVVYLRSLPPVHNPLPRTQLPAAELQRIAARLRPLGAPVVDPPRRTAVERGRHLLEIADCAGCHTSWHSPRMPGLYGGGNRIEREGRAAFSTNLTPDATGLLYGAETFAAVMRTGRFGTLSPLMPWVAFRRLSDADLADMHAALASASPVAHAVSNGEPPTQCAVCGATHGGGERSVPARPTPAEVPSATLQRYAGRYHLAAYDETVEVEWADGALWLVAVEGRLAMVPTSTTRFAVPGWLQPVEFELGADGAVRAMVGAGIWPDRYERLAPR